MTRLQCRKYRKDGRKLATVRPGGADNASLHGKPFFTPSYSSKPSAAASASRAFSLLVRLRPMARLERRLQKFDTLDSSESRVLSSAATPAAGLGLDRLTEPELLKNVSAEFPAGFHAELACLSDDLPAELPVHIPKTPLSSPLSPSLSSSTSRGLASSSIAASNVSSPVSENSINNDLPVLQILNTSEPIPPHNVTEVFSVVRHKSTVIDTASIFVMKHIAHDNGHGSHVLAYPLSLNDVSSICNHPLRSSLSGSRTLYEIAVPLPVASAFMAFEVSNIAYGDTAAQRELLSHTSSSMLRPFWTSLVRKRDSYLYRYGRLLCESILYALLNRNEVAGRCYWAQLMRLIKASDQYAKAYGKMLSCEEGRSATARLWDIDEKPANDWGQECTWLRLWVIDRVSPYKKFPISTHVNVNRGVEKEFSPFVQSSRSWPAEHGMTAERNLDPSNPIEWRPRLDRNYINSSRKSISAPYVHNCFTETSLYADNDSSECESEYYDAYQHQAEKSKSTSSSSDRKYSEDRSSPTNVTDKSCFLLELYSKVSMISVSTYANIDKKVLHQSAGLNVK